MFLLQKQEPWQRPRVPGQGWGGQRAPRGLQQRVPIGNLPLCRKANLQPERLPLQTSSTCCHSPTAQRFAAAGGSRQHSRGGTLCTLSRERTVSRALPGACCSGKWPNVPPCRRDGCPGRAVPRGPLSALCSAAAGENRQPRPSWAATAPTPPRCGFQPANPGLWGGTRRNTTGPGAPAAAAASDWFHTICGAVSPPRPHFGFRNLAPSSAQLHHGGGSCTPGRQDERSRVAFWNS